jgi:hypothetical protein
MQNTDVKLRNLKDYLTQDRVIRIPPWQREYGWKPTENGQVGVLLSDMKEFIDSDDPEYLIGSVIICPDPDLNGRFLLIDGQQRSMTFLIFLMAARKFIKNENLNVEDGHPLSSVIDELKDCISAKKDEYSERVYMNQDDANKILESLYLWSTASDDVGDDLLFNADKQTITQQNLVNVAKFIYRDYFKKNKWVPKEDNQFLGAIHKVLHCIRFVELQLGSQDEAITVYDHINDRGLPLSSADIIKNRIFQHVNENQFAEVSAQWILMTKTLGAIEIASIRDPKFLLRAIATAEKGQKVTYPSLTGIFGKKLDPKVSDEGVKKEDPIEFAYDLADAATHLKNFGEDCRHDLHGELSALAFPRELNSIQQYPILMAARKIQDKKVFLRVVKQIANRTAFYTLSSERTQDFESLVPKWAHGIEKAGPKITIQQADEIYLQSANISAEGFMRLESVLRELNYKSSGDRAKIRAILAHLSWILDERMGKHPTPNTSIYDYFLSRKVKDGPAIWHIDHIQPSLGAGKESPLHGLGNLTLMYPTDNMALGSAKPSAKVTHYAQNPVYLTKSLTNMSQLIAKEKEKIEQHFADAGITQIKWNLENWDQKSIDARFDLYFALLKSDLTTY